MEANSEDQKDESFSNDITEPVEMDMEKSDEEAEENGKTYDQADDYTYQKVPSPPLPPSPTPPPPSPPPSPPQSKEECVNGDKTEDTIVTNIIQVINVSPHATLEQVKTLFGYLGDIVNIQLYHSDVSPETNYKVCFVEFADQSSVLMAQHLTNTVLIDGALIVSPYTEPSIPDKELALSIIRGLDNNTCPHSGLASKLSTGVSGPQTTDSRLTNMGVPQYPQLPVNTDPSRIEEIRRTVYIGNLDSSLTGDQVLRFFNNIGEVKYIRLAGDDTQPTRFAFVEFTDQSSVAHALQHNGFVLGSTALKINHSNNAIVKPQRLKIDSDDISKRSRIDHSSTRDFSSQERSSSRYKRDRDRTRDRDRDRHRDRRTPPRDSRSRRSRSRDRDLTTRRRTRSPRDRDRSRRSRSRDRSVRRRSRSRDSHKRRSRSKSSERSRSSRHRKSSRR